MKRFLLSLALVVATALCMAQNNTVNLGFVGTGLDGTYKCLSTVKVENLSRGWTETLVYPDTVLTLTASVGIEEADEDDFALEGYPNPFGGNTMVSLQLPRSEDVYLQIYDLSGRRIAEHRQSLPAGRHAFRITLCEPQLYMLVASTNEGHTSLKLLNQSSGETNAITDCGPVKSPTLKMRSNQTFQLGDFMRYTGYIINGNDTTGSNIITQMQNGSEMIMLQFADKPTITTRAIDSVTGTSVLSGGAIVSDGGAIIYQRGVCWSTLQNPTVYDTHTTDGVGNGSFVSRVTGLTPGTLYYIRAYAINTAGISYGNQLTVTTPVLPTVTTAPVSGVWVDTAVSGGNVTSDGGAAIIARGVCWSTSPNPTVTDGHTSDSTGAGAFVSHVTGLVTGTTYYLRAYATNLPPIP